jgi:cytochrome c553
MKKALALSTLLTAALFWSAPVAWAQDAKGGNAAEGEKKATMCIGCHGIVGYQATHPQVYKVPMISGQNAKFIVSSLVAYQKGERRHPTMRAIAGSLTEQDMADLGAHYEAHAKGARAPEAAAEPAGDVKELLTKGACSSCHGANFSKPIDGSYPKLAGQHADYLYAALMSYKVKGNGHGRENAIMGGQVAQFTSSQLKAIAGYLASLPGEMQTVPQAKFISHTAAAK